MLTKFNSRALRMCRKNATFAKVMLVIANINNNKLLFIYNNKNNVIYNNKLNN